MVVFGTSCMLYRRPTFGTPHSPTAKQDAVPDRKRLASKEAPATLVAVDRSRCAVPTDRFEKAKIGDHVWCNWHAEGDRSP
jgi:hypothetical protein